MSTVNLVGLLDLERLERDLFRGHCIAGRPLRAFGGQVAAQALTAAGRTVGPGRAVHSLHGYFLRSGDPSMPIVYQVERLRDGHSYAARRVTAIQHKEVIFSLSASFKVPETTTDRQPRMPPVSGPEELEDPEVRPYPALSGRPGSVVSLRFVSSPDAAGATEADGLTRQSVWFKASERLPDDPLLHVCALAYCSDLTLARTATLDRESPWSALDETPAIFMASLDHAMWFHRPFRADDWILFEQRSPSASDGRGFATGDFWTRDGQLVASVVQEAVLRPERRSNPTSSTPSHASEESWCCKEGVRS